MSTFDIIEDIVISTELVTRDAATGTEAESETEDWYEWAELGAVPAGLEGLQDAFTRAAYCHD